MARRQLERNDRNFSRVMRRDGSVCQYCGGPADSVDHVLPVSYFSDNSLENLVAACMPCNLAAWAFVFDSFEAKREFIRQRRGIPGNLPAPAVGLVADEPSADDGSWVTVVDAVWGEPEDENEPLPDDPGEWDHLCMMPTFSGRGCRILRHECMTHDQSQPELRILPDPDDELDPLANPRGDAHGVRARRVPWGEEDMSAARWVWAARKMPRT